MSTESTVTADVPGDGPDRTQGAERAVGQGAEGPAGRHPLEPLTADEVAAATAILKAERGLGPEARFVFVGLHEPPKDAVRGWAPGAAVPLEASILLRDRKARETYEAVVSLDPPRVVSMVRLDGVQPPITAEEFTTCETAVRADPRWQAAMRLRGVEDLSLCLIDPWSSGAMGDDNPDGRRVCRPLTWVRAAPGDNGLARPVEGLVALVDLDTGEVVEVTDHGVVPLPARPGNYEPDLLTAPGNVPAFPKLRDDLKPIHITQPDGVSFTLDGHQVRWQKWSLRVGFNAREGLVLHQVGYTDRGRLRPVLQRASLSEMYVPYGDPAPSHQFKNVFDAGEYGIGWMTNPLTRGCDCLGEIAYLHGVVNDQDGNPVTIPNAVCIHEEDFGIGWKHTDDETGNAAVRRLRRLVVSAVVTVGNYDYGFYWYLYTDGTIEYEVKLTGILSTGAVPPGVRPRFGTLLAPGLYGPNHQHFFCVRLDMEVDGAANTVVEVDSEPLPAGPDNPLGTAWVARRTALTSERAAQRLVDPLRARHWRIENPEVRNAGGDPVAYALLPGENVRPMAHPDSTQARRGGFAQRHLWVTPYHPRERFAAGDYPNQHPGPQGLPAWTRADRPVEATDLVVWYAFGAHHVVRPEDWPVMPVARIGFTLKPWGFFDGNPSLDVPPADADHCAPG